VGSAGDDHDHRKPYTLTATRLRHFCPECGSSIAQEPGTRPGVVVLNVGTLDDAKSITPAREIFCDDALPWVQTTEDMPRCAKRPV
jgi:hypothetical protein